MYRVRNFKSRICQKGLQVKFGTYRSPEKKFVAVDVIKKSMSFWLSENPVEIESDEKNEIRAVSRNIFHNVSYASSETNLGFLIFFFCC